MKQKYYYTGRLGNDWFACYKFSDVPYHLESVKHVRASSKHQALNVRQKYENLYLLLPLAPASKVKGLIAELTSIKLLHDIHG